MDLAPYLPGFAAAYSILIVAVLSPGPAVAMILGVALSRGRRAALLASLGVACGSSGLAVASVLGVSALVAHYAWMLNAVRLLGAIYLAWLAWGAFRRAAHPPPFGIHQTPPTRSARIWAAGVLMQLGNPKAIVFWIAIASVGATNAAPAGVVALFLLGAFAMSLAGHAGYALALSARPVRAAYLGARRWVEASLGTFFAFTALRLALTRN